MVPHLQRESTILADEVQNVRAFGSEDQAQGVTQIVNERLTDLRAMHEVTLEHMRAGAIKGLVLDADLSTLLDLHTAFNVSQSTAEMDLATDDIRSQVVAIQRTIEGVLGAEMVSGYRAFCGDVFFDSLIEASNVRDSLKYQESAVLRGDLRKFRWTFSLFFPRVALWLLFLLVLPHFELLRMSFVGSEYAGKSGVTLENYSGFFKEIIYWRTFVRTAVFSVLVTCVALAISLPVAFYVTKIAGFKTQGFLMVLILLPFWVSELIRVYGWMILLRESGVIGHFMIAVGLWKEPVEMLYNDAVIIMGLVYTTLLFMIVPIIGVMESLDDSLIVERADQRRHPRTT